MESDRLTFGGLAVLLLLMSAVGSAAVAADQVEGLKTFSQSDWGAGKNADAKQRPAGRHSAPGFRYAASQ